MVRIPRTLIRYFLAISVVLFYQYDLSTARAQSSFMYSATIDSNESIQDIYRAMKVIRISQQLMKEWDLSDNYTQQFCYDVNKDRTAPPNQNVIAVYTRFWNYNYNKLDTLELIDDGLHFDNELCDGIYGNFLVGNIDEFKTDETIINVLFDSIGITHAAIFPPVNFVPEPPKILSPLHQSIVTSTIPIVQWIIDEGADGCGIILFDSKPVVGKRFGHILWQKNYEKTVDTIYVDTIPVFLNNGKNYHLIVWSYVDTKIIGGNWSGQAYSMEWSSFTIDKMSGVRQPIVQQTVDLIQNYPNPFNEFTTVSWQQRTEEQVSLIIYNILGKEVKQLVNDVIPAGQNFVTWDGTNSNGYKVSSGIYVLRARAKGIQRSVKLKFFYK